MKNFKTLIAAAAVIIAAAPSAQAAQDHIKVGVVGENNEQWKPVIEQLHNEGVELEIIRFNDYTTPNRALEDGDIDLHACMTGRFLRTECEGHDYHLTAIGTTLISPLGLYSNKIKSLSEVEDGAKFAIPNDPITTGRSLRLLELNGIIKLKPDSGWTPATSDIIENPHDVEFYFVEPGNAYAVLDDVTGSFINGYFAVDHGLSVQNDSVVVENTEGWGLDHPFVNVIASRTADKDNELYNHVVELYHTKPVADILINVYKGAYIPAFKY